MGDKNEKDAQEFGAQCGRDVSSLLFCFRIRFQENIPQKYICSLASGTRRRVQEQDALWQSRGSWQVKQ